MKTGEWGRRYWDGLRDCGHKHEKPEKVVFRLLSRVKISNIIKQSRLGYGLPVELAYPPLATSVSSYLMGLFLHIRETLTIQKLS